MNDTHERTELTNRQIVCIACPVGCRINVQYVEGGCGVMAVLGNKCKRGEDYAVQEILAPRRTVTAVVATTSSAIPFAPVRTDKPLPMELIDKLLVKIYSMRITVPVKIGQPIIENFEETGINVVLSRSVQE